MILRQHLKPEKNSELENRFELGVIIESVVIGDLSDVEQERECVCVCSLKRA